MFGLLSSIIYFGIFIQKDFTWSQKIIITHSIKDDVDKNITREREIYDLFEQMDYMLSHPFCTSKRIIEDKGSEKTFEIVEELKLMSLIPLKLVSTAYMKKLSDNQYYNSVVLNILGVFKSNFDTEFIINKNIVKDQGGEKVNYEIEEKVTIKGPQLVTFIVGNIAYPEHQLMMSKIKNKYSE